jgi:hypothetical protein
LQHYDPVQKAWCVEPGVFRVLLGTSAADIRLSAEFRATGRNPYGYGPETPIYRIVGDPRAVAVLLKYLPMAVASPEALQMDLVYSPHRSLDAIWETRFDRALESASAKERAAIKEQVYRELAEIET